MTDERTHYFGDDCDPPHECPGGPAVEVDAVHSLAQCRCGIWFTTVMDEPVFPPHTVRATGVTFGG